MRPWIPAASALAVLALAAPATATEDKPLQFSWNGAAPSCASSAAIAERVEQLLAGASRRDGLEAAAVVSHRRDGAWVADLRTRLGVTEGRRHLVASSCEKLGAATALVLALIIDPDLQVVPAEVEPEPPPRLPNEAPESEAVSSSASASHPAESARPHALHAALGAVAFGDVGSMPSFDAGASLVGALVRAPFRGELHVDGLWPEKTNAQARASAGGRFDRFGVGLRGCASTPTLWFAGACAGVEIDRVHATGFGVTDDSAASRYQVMPRAGILLGVTAYDTLEFSIRGDALVPVSRPTFALQNVGTVFRDNAVEIRFGLAVLMHFR